VRRLAVALLALPLLAVGLSSCVSLTPVSRTVTYSVAVDGAVISDVNEFADTAANIYASPRGWRDAGIQFVRVPSGGDFTLVLANPRQVETYDPVCSYLYSCTVGRYVVIRKTRRAFLCITFSAIFATFRNVCASSGPLTGALFIGGMAMVWAEDVGDRSSRDAITMPTNSEATIRSSP